MGGWCTKSCQKVEVPTPGELRQALERAVAARDARSQPKTGGMGLDPIGYLEEALAVLDRGGRGSLRTHERNVAMSMIGGDLVYKGWYPIEQRDGPSEEGFFRRDPDVLRGLVGLGLVDPVERYSRTHLVALGPYREVGQQLTGALCVCQVSNFPTVEIV